MEMSGHYPGKAIGSPHIAPDVNTAWFATRFSANDLDIDIGR